ncbi:biotin--[acetyl-CoA-carboxylase] ligase [Candidatus Nitrosotenuis cloacae]|uniref:biotin--[acetyl-CoA-carboxylase] ligase n=1 Tax=Candidatus Nitrosotenuis cloacae TaxID=1603555 RepID=UPI0022816C50|nr:biotin--[acetyl-CoA-carboxylase] ligase [Candidatus Nitrosotenuis cloacae]
MLYTSYDNTGLIRVLQFLKAHQLEYLSGEDLSEVLKISRVAIWKHIKKIQSLGYKIESKQNLGYRLTGTTDLVLPWEVSDGLKTKTIGQKAYYFDSIDSTQNFATKLAKDPEESGSVVIAQTQTLGKGRLGRKWVSPKGGIWLSVVLHPGFDVSKITIVPLATAVALSNAIEKSLGIKTELKWPNDITIGGKKAAGMIIDASIESSKIESLVLGVGINFKVNPAEIERKIKSNENYYGVATLVKKNSTEKPARLVQAFLVELEQILVKLGKDDSQGIINQWTKKSSTIGKKVSISTSGGKITGKAVKIEKDGSLQIKQNSKQIRVSVGDVSYK